MSEANTNPNVDPNTQNTDPNGQQNTDPNTDPNKGKDENFIPKSRFDEVNNKYKEMKAQLDELLTKKEVDEVESKKKAGEYEDLYNKTKNDLDKFKNESKSFKERTEALEGVINSMLETKLQTVPEEFRDLIPSGMAPEAKLAWLAQAEAKGLFGSVSKKEQALGGNTNPSGKQNSDLSKLSPMELLKAAYSQAK